MKLVKTFTRVFQNPDLRKKLLFTIGILVLFRLVAQIPVPNISRDVLKDIISQIKILNLTSSLTGGNLQQFSIVAFGVGPFINASIIMQLFTMIIPQLEELSKDGERGRNKINQITRYLTLPLAAIQSFGMIIFLKGYQINGLYAVDPNISFLHIMQIVVTVTAGSLFLMWLGELITQNGIGNGVSLIIFAGIVGTIPKSITSLLQSDSGNLINLLVFVVVSVFTVLVVTVINEGQRRIPVTYSKRVRGNKIYGGADTHIPLKVNTAGVIPIIFAVSIISFPSLIATPFTTSETAWVSSLAGWFQSTFSTQSPAYYLIYFFLIIGFTFFYTLITFNPTDVADNLKKQGGFIPGIRPGSSTVDYLTKILNRITLAGAVFLGLIAVFPFLIESFTGIPAIIQSTSLLIVVSVILETVRQIESQLIMRDYEQFLDK